MSQKFYITTPIYYVNDQPHIGHAYTTIAADILARYHRMRGRNVFFLTGTDEHGQKVEQAAAARGHSPKAHADIYVENFKALWAALGITHDAFIRTTDEQHKEIVQDLMQKLWKRGEIAKRSYAGWYCTPCERFWTEKDLLEGDCPDCKRAVEKIEEENYFFLMSKYHDRLVKHIEDNPSYILPETRRNEVLGFLRSQPLGDLCISRPISRLSWGIPLPFDTKFVTYVWFDALINYYSATQYLAPQSTDAWPADVHLIGKDILTTHAVYWSAMLMALGMPLPATIFAHGWWTIEGRKMSKSLGNVVDPTEMARKYGNDAFRYFLFREVPFGHDGDFSVHAIEARYNVDLANDLGNLASRALKMAEKYFESKVPQPAEVESELKTLCEAVEGQVEVHLKVLQFHRAIEDIWKIVSYANKYIDSNAPWVLAKDPANEGRLRTVIYSTLEALRFLTLYLKPFMPDATAKLASALGSDSGEFKWGGLKAGTELKPLEALFPRIEVIKEAPVEDKKQKPKKEKIKVSDAQQTPAPATTAPIGDNLIAIEDFMKVELKTGVVKHAERVPKSDKLLRLEVDTGEMRQIVAGIGKVYSPEDMIGKTIVVVANLKPAKLMGVESQGMLLAANDKDGNPAVLTPERPANAGVRVK